METTVARHKSSAEKGPGGSMEDGGTAFTGQESWARQESATSTVSTGSRVVSIPRRRVSVTVTKSALPESLESGWRNIVDKITAFRGVKVDLSTVFMTAQVRPLLSWFQEQQRALVSLILSKTKIGDDDIIHLTEFMADNATLHTLSLASNDLGPAVAKLLAEALSKNKTLLTLDLLNNKLGDVGSKHLASGLRTNRTLHSLNLEFNGISSVGIFILANALRAGASRLRVLTLNHNDVGDAGAEYLATALRENSYLETLNMRHTGVGFHGVQFVASAMGDMHEMHKARKVMQAAGRQDLTQKSRTMAKLAGTILGGMSSSGRAAPAKRHSSHNDVFEQILGDASSAAVALPPLSPKSPSSATLSPKSLLKSPRGRVNSDDSSFEADSDEDETCEDQQDPVHVSFEWKKMMDTLQEQKKVQPAQCHLTINKSLISLNLARNKIGDRAVERLAGAMVQNPGFKLQTLNLMQCEVGDKGVKHVAKALKTNCTLETLNLGRNFIGDAGAEDLAEAMKENMTLRCLQLWENRIGAAGAQKLSFALRDNPTLTELGLCFNNVGGASVYGVAKTFPASMLSKKYQING